MNPLCNLCDSPIEPSDQPKMYRRIVGWEQRRAQGGTNHVTLRQETGEVAHADCVRLRNAGLTGQDSML